MTLELAQVVVATVATLCMIGLGFLQRPSRATAIWSLTFVVVMVTTYAALVSQESGDETMRLAAMGVLLAAPALIWSGLRAHRGARPLEWIALVLALAWAVILPALGDWEGYPWVYRIAFATMGTFAALTVVELVRRPGRGSGTAIPLAAFSLVTVGVAVTSLAAGLLSPGDPSTTLTFLRTANALGLLAYIVCALITLLFLARGEVVTQSGSTFSAVATERLARAQTAGERSWALVYVCIDDHVDLRAVTGETGFAAINARLYDDIVDLFPTEADIGRFPPASYAILVAAPSTVVRERVRSLLRAVSTPQEGVRVGTSASIGWAGVAEFGYDLDTLLSAAVTAAGHAAADGGDRWERALASA